MSAIKAPSVVDGLVPVIDDPETGGIFAAAAEGRLVAQSCTECGNLQQPPRPRCVACRSAELGWTELPGTGKVHSWTVVEHQINPRYPVPYTVVLVDVEPHPGAAPLRFLGHLPGRPEISIGTAVRVVFEERDEGVVLPNWELDEN